MQERDTHLALSFLLPSSLWDEHLNNESPRPILPTRSGVSPTALRNLSPLHLRTRRRTAVEVIVAQVVAVAVR